MEFNLKISLESVRLSDIHPSSLPVLIVLPSAIPEDAVPDEVCEIDTETREGPQDVRLVFVLRTDSERALCLLENIPTPQTLLLQQLEEEMTGQVIFFAPQHEQVNEQGAVRKAKSNKHSSTGKFGFRWFIPELLKHKKIWREIIAASFAIQLVALATPLCTQVIIDKVVVHHTTSTLIVIASA
jgi:subfamily B ATP-binding cassette protein HlyB/CyaB